MTTPADLTTRPGLLQSSRQGFRRFRQERPHIFLLLLMVIVPLFLMSPSAWLMLTISGIAMGAMLFLMASGMTLTFGLMNVLNLAHGAFITLGAFAGATVLVYWLGEPAAADSLLINLAAIVPALLFAMVVAGVIGFAFERLMVRPVYGDHLKQILVTVGGSIIIMQLVQVVWGHSPISVPQPTSLDGSFLLGPGIPVIGSLVLEKYRLAALVLGLLVYAAMLWVIQRTRLGILIRAGVENREMVEVHGYRVGLLFLGVFIAGSALAGLGGAMWAMYRQSINAHIGDGLMISVIVVIILGGLGSVRGCFYGALLAGLINLYVGYLQPELAAVATVGLMVGVLMWRPHGLIPVAKP